MVKYAHKVPTGRLYWWAQVETRGNAAWLGPSIRCVEDPMTKRIGYPLLGLFVLYLISLNATDTGEKGNDFLTILGGLIGALLDFVRGLTGDTTIAAIIGL